MAQSSTVEALARRIEELETRDGPSRGIPPFRGDVSESFLQWIQDYELMGQVKGWNQEKMARNFSAYLADMAKEFYRQLSEDTQKSWRDLKEAFSIRFVPPAITALHAATLLKRQQGVNEGVAAYATDVSRLTRLAYPNMPPEYREQIQKHVFIQGLRPHIKDALQRSNPAASYAEAYTFAANQEVGDEMGLGPAIGPRQGMLSSSSSNGHVFAGFALQRTQANRREQQDAPQVNMGRYQFNRRQSRGGGESRREFQYASDGKPICARCGGKGHVKRECPTGGNGQQRQQSSSTSSGHGNYSGWRGGRTRGRTTFRGRGGRGQGSRGRINFLGQELSTGPFPDDYTVEEYTPEYNTPVSEPNSRDLEELKQENERLRLQNHRYQEREAEQHSSFLGSRRGAGRLSTYLPIVMALLIGSLLPISLGQSLKEDPALVKNLHICPRTLGSSLWQIPEPHTCEIPSGLENSCIRTQEMNFFKEETNLNQVNASFCACISTQVGVLSDFSGKKKYLNFSATPIPVTEVECYRMVHGQKSEFGELHWNGAGWSTNNHLEYPTPVLPFGCCRWVYHQASNCHVYYAPLYQKNPLPNTESVGAEFPFDCSYQAGSCATKDGRFILWEPKDESNDFCVLSDPEGTKVPGYELVTPKGKHLWAALDGSRALQFWYNILPYDGKQCPGTKQKITFGYEPQTKQIYEPGNKENCVSNLTASISVSKFRSLFVAACKSMSRTTQMMAEFLKATPTRMVQQLARVNNLTAYVIGPMLRIRPCFDIPKGSYELLEPTWEENRFGFLPLKFVVEQQSYMGYLNVETKEVVPYIGLQGTDRLDRLQATWVERSTITPGTRTIYPISFFGQNPRSWQPLPTNVIPPYFLEGWPREPPGEYSILSSPDRVKEVDQFLAELFPFWDPVPVGAQHILVFAICVYVLFFAVLVHCCPTFCWVYYLNPPFWIWKRIAKRCCRRCSKHRYSSPPVQRRMQEQLPLVQPQRSHRYIETHGTADVGNNRTVIPDPNGSGRLVPVFQCGKIGKLSAITKVKVNQYSRKALLDTGSSISLIQKEEAVRMKLRVNQAEEEIHGVTIDGSIFPLLGTAKVNFTVGSRTFKDHDVYIADSPPCSVLLGIDLLKRLGPFLLDFTDRTLHLYTRKPKAAADILKIGEEWDEWPVTVAETVMVPARSQHLIHATCSAPEAEDLLLLPAKTLPDTKGIAVASALVRVSKQKAPVCFLNTQNHPVLIYKNTTLGCACCLGQVPVVAMAGKVLRDCNSVNPQAVPDQKRLKTKEPSKDPLADLDLSGSKLSEEEANQLKALLREYADIFAASSHELGCLPTVKHKIDTGDAAPINQRPYRTPISQRQIEREELEKMKKAGVIRPSTSPWSSPVVLVPKPDGSTRFCADFRRLNSVTRPDPFPLPLISEVLDSLAGAAYFTNMDLQSGYWQIEVSEEDIEKTAVITYDGKWEFTRMPFGLCNAPATFQRAMQMVLSGLGVEGTLIYLDDCVVQSATFEEHLKRLRNVFQRFREYNLKLKLKKCRFAMDSIKFLGHIVSSDGLKVDPQKTEAVMKFPEPKTVTEVRRFLGMVGYYRRFVDGFARIARPLFSLLKKNPPEFGSPEIQAAFAALKDKLLNAPVLAYPDFRKPFVIETDASGYGLGAVLGQLDEKNKLKPVAFASRVMSSSEQNYTVTEQECLAVHWALKLFRPYVYGRTCTIYTDHQALRWLMTQSNPSGRLCRWALSLQEYHLEIKYRPGASNHVADALSRAPVGQVNFLDGTVNSLAEAQRKDKQLRPLIKFLEGETPDTEEEREELSARTSMYQLQDGVLVKLPDTPSQNHRYVVPKAQQLQILHQYHDSALAAHTGVSKMRKTVGQKYYWTGMSRDILDYVRTCDSCQKRKSPIPKPNPPMQPIPVYGPFHTVAMDIQELPQSYDGNRYVLVFADMFTKWVEATPMPDQSASRVAQAFVDLIICRFGAPRRLLSDKALNFRADVVKEITRLCGTKQIFTSGYAPQTNGLVERYNRTLQDSLTHLVDKAQRDWDQYLSAVLFAARMTVQESTGASPFYLLFGQDPLLPLDVVFQYHLSPYVDPSDLPYTEQLQWRLTTAWKEAQENIRKSQDNQKYYHDLKASHSDYKVGDVVMVYRPEWNVGRAAKLGFPWTGPYKVIEVIGLNTMLVPVEDPYCMPFRVHMRKLKYYNKRPLSVLEPVSEQPPEPEMEPPSEEIPGESQVPPAEESWAGAEDVETTPAVRIPRAHRTIRSRSPYQLRTRVE